MSRRTTYRIGSAEGSSAEFSTCANCGERIVYRGIGRGWEHYVNHVRDGHVTIPVAASPNETSEQ